MSADALTCPKCGAEVKRYKNPFPTVDIVIELPDSSIILIKRKNPPLGWALPGGFIDYGESAENAAVREAREESGLDVELTGLVGVYSDPNRDPRFHTLSVVFSAKAQGEPKSGDGAAEARPFSIDKLPEEMAFDHKNIIRDFIQRRSSHRT